MKKLRLLLLLLIPAQAWLSGWEYKKPINVNTDSEVIKKANSTLNKLPLGITIVLFGRENYLTGGGGL